MNTELSITQIKAALPQFSNLEVIGRGGFKTVFKSNYESRTEVLKLIGLSANQKISGERYDEYYEEQLKRAAREIKALSQFKSPFIVKLGTLPPRLIKIQKMDYVAYSEEYLDGKDLGKIIQTNNEKPRLVDCVQLFKALLSAIQEMWSKGYIHRDIKPLNIIKLENQNRPFVLLDFGIAFNLFTTALTVDAAGRPPVGTYCYLAPEMFSQNHRQHFDLRSDLYSAALTVYEYATKVHPIIGAQDEDFNIAMVRPPRISPKPLFSLRQDLDPNFCSLIDSFLKKNPALRPANTKQIIHKLENYQ